MIGQNSYSGNNFNPFGKQPGTTGVSTTPASVKEKKQSSKKTIPIIVGVVVLAGLGVGAYFLLRKPANDPTSGEPTATVTENNKISISGDKTDQEVKDQFDNAISSAKDEDEALNAKFSKISFEIMSGEFEAALSELKVLEGTTLSDYDQYRLHNYYTTAYKGLGNESEAARHQTLADEAHERDLNSVTLE